MEAQLLRVKQKRKERLEAEYKALHPESDEQLREFKKAKTKRARLLEQIKKLRDELENTYNNNDVTKLENNLEAEKIRLAELYVDTQGQNKVRQLQKAALDEKEEAGDKIKGKGSQMMNKFREAKLKYKSAQEI